MSFQILPPAEALPTLAAVVRFLPRVDPLVFFQVSRLTETSPTLNAPIRLLSRMTPLVDSQVPHPAECLSTHNTQVGFFSPEVLHAAFSPIERTAVGFCEAMPPLYGLI